MGPILEKTANPSRTLILGLLASCRFTTCTKKCPLNRLLDDSGGDAKKEYALDLTDREVEKILTQHKSCYKKRLSDLNQW